MRNENWLGFSGITGCPQHHLQRVWEGDVWASSLGYHQIDVHDIYQQAVVSKELLKEHEGVTDKAQANGASKLPCPYRHCHSELNLNSRWMIQQFFVMSSLGTLWCCQAKGSFP
jgi:hypothetical protein